MPDKAPFKAGYIAIIGRPNTGKSTLLNAIVKQKISIVSRKPQTTRWHVQGIKTSSSHQFIFIDTPGYQTRHNTAVNRLMNKEVVNSLSYCDLIIWVTVAMQWEEEDEQVLSLLADTQTDVILLVNKVDQIKDKKVLLPFVEGLHERYCFKEIIPLSVRKDKDIAMLENKLSDYLPMGERIYDDDRLTNRSERFIVAEYLREQIFIQLGDELPYKTAVTIDKYEDKKKLTAIYATIWIESISHKAIIIGDKGMRLKSIGQAAREEMQVLLGKKVFLKTWVKLKKNWTDDVKALKQLGYADGV